MSAYLLEKQHKPIALIVDDELMMRAMISETLTGVGFEVHEAETGETALEVVAKVVPDVIFLDVIMPGKDGYQTCEELRNIASCKHLPIVMVTGREDSASIERAYRAGATDFIAKPINYDILGHRAHYILRASKAFETLKASEKRLAEAHRLAHLANWEWDIANNRFTASEHFSTILDIDAEGTHPIEWLLDLIPEEERNFLAAKIALAKETGEGFQCDHRVASVKGRELFLHNRAEVILDENGSPRYLFGTFQDITERKTNEERIRHLAYYDRLTGIPNQIFFREHFNRELAAVENSDRVALFYLNLDRFKNINNTLGHRRGDVVLQMFAERFAAFSQKHVGGLHQHKPGLENCARLGGDEFAFWTAGHQDVASIRAVAEDLITFFSEPYVVEGHEIYLVGCAGIAVYPDDGEDIEQILKSSHASMHFAKTLGKNSYQFYFEAIDAGVWTTFKLEQSLRSAMERDEFHLHYQPQIDLKTGQLCGAEALIRWTSEERGNVSPAEFIPLAEETGIIIQIGEWVLRRVCRQIREWEGLPAFDFAISLNFSPRQFLHYDFVNMITGVLQEENVSPARIHIELTESVLIQDEVEVISRITELKEAGIEFSIDDFGTGYSSLNYLRQLAVDYLKIDKSFIDDIHTEKGASIIDAIITMAHSLEMQVVAEGVEDPEQFEKLCTQGCDIVQGYLYSRPIQPSDFFVFMDKPNRLLAS